MASPLYLAGRLRLKCDDPKAALSDLQRARQCEPGNWQTLAALSTAHDVLGHRAAAREAAERIARAAPVYVAPRHEEQQATILVLNRMPRGAVSADHGLHGVHFTRNYISQISQLMAKQFRFASVFADLPDPLPNLPSADVVFHNIASAEQMNLPGQLDQVMELVERIDRPVINHPRAVLQMTRQKAADLLQGITGLRVPRIARYRRDIARFDEIKSDIASKFTYPVIVRHLAADQSSKSLLSENKTAILVNDADELEIFLEGVSWPQFYVIQYVNLRKADGNFRKLRAMFFGDQIIIGSGGYYSEWMVGGWRTPKEGQAFYKAFPHLVAEMNRILLDPEGMLGPQLMPVLEAVRDRVPLDVFGMDFDVDDDGRLVLFEAQSTMVFLPRPDMPEHLRMPQELGERINGAFRCLVRRKIAAEG